MQVTTDRAWPFDAVPTLQSMRSEIFSNAEQQVAAPGFVLQNSKMLKATVNGEFFARRGGMVAYQGNVRFEYQGVTSGAGSMKDCGWWWKTTPTPWPCESTCRTATTRSR